VSQKESFNKTEQTPQDIWLKKRVVCLEQNLRSFQHHIEHKFGALKEIFGGTLSLKNPMTDLWRDSLIRGLIFFTSNGLMTSDFKCAKGD